MRRTVILFWSEDRFSCLFCIGILSLNWNLKLTQVISFIMLSLFYYVEFLLLWHWHKHEMFFYLMMLMLNHFSHLIHVCLVSFLLFSYLQVSLIRDARWNLQPEPIGSVFLFFSRQSSEMEYDLHMSMMGIWALRSIWWKEASKFQAIRYLFLPFWRAQIVTHLLSRQKAARKNLWMIWYLPRL